MTTNSKDLKPIWNELECIFKSYKKYNDDIETRLKKLNINTTRVKGNHVKLCFLIDGIKKYVTIATTPSDTYAGKQILRQIRRLYEWK